MKEFILVFQNAKSDFQYVWKNPYSIPTLVFQQLMDVYENNFNDLEW